MPSITTTIPNIEKHGPILEVHFLISKDLENKYIEEGKELPAPIIVNALIDTGASACVIQKSIPEKLDLKPVGIINISTPSCKETLCNQYFLRMIIPIQGITYEGIFTAAPLDGQNIKCLIGRDLLKSGILIYIGYADQFTFSLL